MDISTYVEKVRSKGKWKNPARIVGQAAEDWAEDNLTCFQEGCDGSLKQYPNNKKSKDFFCECCGKNYQIKAGKTYKINKKGTLSVTGADYETTVRHLTEGKNLADYIIIGYNPGDYSITFAGLVRSPNVQFSNIIRRKPLGPHCRRAGWVGCYLKFDKSVVENIL